MARLMKSFDSIRALERRRVLLGLTGGMLLTASRGWPQAPLVTARFRIISDNDFAGDPDGLFQLAHHLLSPSVEIRLIVGSHLHPGEIWDKDGPQAARSADKAQELLQLMGLRQHAPVIAGAELALASTKSIARTTAAEAIIAEAMREVGGRPLFYVAGAGLTDLATAWLLEPRIERRMKVIWIGGPEYAGAGRPPGRRQAEYNLTIDAKAAQVIFNRAGFEIWQIPRSTYRQMLFSYRELVARVRPTGKVGDYLVGNIERMMRKLATLPPSRGIVVGETYILGDSPLVTLTALQSQFQPDPSSSSYEMRPRPTINDEGDYGRAAGRGSIRVYTHVDARLTFEDMIAKLRMFETA